jgi:polyisoprenoid-binding protein YceI
MARFVRRGVPALIVLAAALSGGCPDPAGDAPAATVGAPSSGAAGGGASAGAVSAGAAAAVGGVETLSFGPPDSSVGFVGAKVTGKHEGSFTAFKGTLTFDPAHLEASRVSADIDAASVTIPDNDKLTNHLKSPDFFDVAKFPRATFTSTAVVPGAAAGAYTITGDLTLHGVTKSISFPATITAAPDAVTASAEFSLNRKDFGIVYPGMPDDLISDLVLLKLAIRAARAAR